MSSIDRAAMVKGLPVDASQAMTGAAVLLVGGKVATRCIEIVNIGTQSIGISMTTITPVIGVPGTVTISAGGTWRSFEGFLPQTPIYAIGPAATPVTCWYF